MTASPTAWEAAATHEVTAVASAGSVPTPLPAAVTFAPARPLAADQAFSAGFGRLGPHPQGPSRPDFTPTATPALAYRVIFPAIPDNSKS